MAEFQSWLQAQKLQSHLQGQKIRGQEAARPSTISVQDRFDKDTDDAFQYITWLADRSDGIPTWGTQKREEWLREFWKKESILAGAVHSAVAKIIGLGWTISGGRNKVARYASILREADGKDWDTFLSKFLLDYLTQDKGAFIEFGSTVKDGPIQGLFNMDSCECSLTGDWDYPVKYCDIMGNWHKMPRTSVSHVCSLPSANVAMNNYGYCAVSRAINAAQILILVNQYEREKLSDLPPNQNLCLRLLLPFQRDSI